MLLIAGLILIWLLAGSGAYGFHGNETYYVVAGQHPALGYVDQPSLTPPDYARQRPSSGRGLTQLPDYAPDVESVRNVRASGYCTLLTQRGIRNARRPWWRGVRFVGEMIEPRSNRDAPAKTAALSVPGASLYYEVRGAGPILLLMPGGPADAEVFTPIAPYLAPTTPS